MRVAVLGDVHGNREALEAVLAHCATLRPDLYVVIGDIVVGAADSRACWERISGLACPVLRGNHEGYILSYGKTAAPTALSTPQFAPVAWAAEQLGAVKCELEPLPFSLNLPELPEFYFVHASQRSDRDNISAYTPDELLLEMFPEMSARFVIRGHDHVAATRRWGKRQLITVGSVGLPLSGVVEAEYLLLERRKRSWRVLFQAVPYDVDAALNRFHSTGYLETAGPMAKLFYREVATASYHLIPFLRGYARWSEGGKRRTLSGVRTGLSTGWIGAANIFLALCPMSGASFSATRFAIVRQRSGVIVLAMACLVGGDPQRHYGSHTCQLEFIILRCGCLQSSSSPSLPPHVSSSFQRVTQTVPTSS